MPPHNYKFPTRIFIMNVNTNTHVNERIMYLYTSKKLYRNFHRANFSKFCIRETFFSFTVLRLTDYTDHIGSNKNRSSVSNGYKSY